MTKRATRSNFIGINFIRTSVLTSCLCKLVVAAIIITGLSLNTNAQSIQMQRGVVKAQDESNANISASQAGSLAKNKYGGKVLKITPVKGKNGTNYSVRILLDSGKVIVVTVDGNSGKVQ